MAFVSSLEDTADHTADHSETAGAWCERHSTSVFSPRFALKMVAAARSSWEELLLAKVPNTLHVATSRKLAVKRFAIRPIRAHGKRGFVADFDVS